MIKKTVPHVIFSIIFSLLFNVQANEISWKSAQEGNKVILIRHALAPGGGDPEGFEINNCATQRNLNQTGINQSIKIGRLFKKYEVPIDKVLSSQWCRCKDTAKYAFKKFDIKVICIEILNYDKFTNTKTKRLINFFKKNKYFLAGKSKINYIFKKKN